MPLTGWVISDCWTGAPRFTICIVVDCPTLAAKAAAEGWLLRCAVPLPLARSDSQHLGLIRPLGQLTYNWIQPSTVCVVKKRNMAAPLIYKVAGRGPERRYTVIIWSSMCLAVPEVGLAGSVVGPADLAPGAAGCPGLINLQAGSIGSAGGHRRAISRRGSSRPAQTADVSPWRRPWKSPLHLGLHLQRIISSSALPCW